MISNVQTQLDSTVKRSGTTALACDVALSGAYKFSGATPTEIGYLSGVSSALQTQINNCVRDNTTLTLTGNIGFTNSGTITFTFCGSTPAELAYVHSATSAIQTQLD